MLHSAQQLLRHPPTHPPTHNHSPIPIHPLTRDPRTAGVCTSVCARSAVCSNTKQALRRLRAYTPNCCKMQCATVGIQAEQMAAKALGYANCTCRGSMLCVNRLHTCLAVYGQRLAIHSALHHLAQQQQQQQRLCLRCWNCTMQPLPLSCSDCVAVQTTALTSWCCCCSSRPLPCSAYRNCTVSLPQSTTHAPRLVRLSLPLSAHPSALAVADAIAAPSAAECCGSCCCCLAA